MNNYVFFLYLLILAGSTYLIRVIPFVAIKNKINNRFIRSFLAYIPYAVLTAMTIPAVFYATNWWAGAAAGLIAAGLLDNPVKYAHIVTSTTHKTLRGPRGGIILMGKDFDNPWGYTTKKGEVKKMSMLLNSAVFPGQQGGPLEHVIAAKAVAFNENLQPSWKEYATQVKKNAAVLADDLIGRGFGIVSGGTDNHSMLVDLRSKYPDLTGKVAENALVAADITVNKNMVPFDTRSAFQTSGIRLGTAAMTTRGAKEDMMHLIAELIEEVLNAPEDEKVIARVREKVNATMKDYPLFAY